MSCVCDFLTSGAGGAVTIKSHGGMSSPHTQKKSRAELEDKLFANQPCMVKRDFAFMVCVRGQNWGQISTRPTLNHCARAKSKSFLATLRVFRRRLAGCSADHFCPFHKPWSSIHFQWIATLGAHLRACIGCFEKDAPSLRPNRLLIRAVPIGVSANR